MLPQPGHCSVDENAGMGTRRVLGLASDDKWLRSVLRFTSTPATARLSVFGRSSGKSTASSASLPLSLAETDVALPVKSSEPERAVTPGCASDRTSVPAVNGQRGNPPASAVAVAIATGSAFVNSGYSEATASAFAAAVQKMLPVAVVPQSLPEQVRSAITDLAFTQQLLPKLYRDHGLTWDQSTAVKVVNTTVSVIASSVKKRGLQSYSLTLKSGLVDTVRISAVRKYMTKLVQRMAAAAPTAAADATPNVAASAAAASALPFAAAPLATATITTPTITTSAIAPPFAAAPLAANSIVKR